jgi:hypothetical protein
MGMFRRLRSAVLAIIIAFIGLQIILTSLAPLIPLAVGCLVVGGTVAAIVSRRSRL